MTQLPDDAVNQGACVRIRGIPFQESEHTVFKWFTDKGVHIRNSVLGVHFLYNEKRQWSGDAYLQLESEKDVEAALNQNEAQMQHRYLEVFRCTGEEMDMAMKRSPFYRLPTDFGVRLRGLEYRVGKEEIRDFFKGLDIAAGLDGIYIVENQEGRPTGEAYVSFENKASVEQATAKHKEKLGQRYVEIFLASSAQIRDAQEFFPDEREPPKFRDYSPEPTSRGGPPAYHGGGGGYYDQYPPVDGYYDRRTDEYGPPRPKGALSRYDPYGVGREFRLYMRGLPWICSEEDIGKFFTPIPIAAIIKNMTSANVFDGSAWVEFDSEGDFMAAKKLHKTNMGHRYIELFSEDEMDAKRLRTNRESRAYGYGRVRPSPAVPPSRRGGGYEREGTERPLRGAGPAPGIPRREAAIRRPNMEAPHPGGPPSRGSQENGRALRGGYGGGSTNGLPSYTQPQLQQQPPAPAYSGYSVLGQQQQPQQQSPITGYPTSSAYQTAGVAGYPNSVTSGYPSNAVSGYQTNVSSGYPTGATSGYPTSTSGYPTAAAPVGYPAASGYLVGTPGYPTTVPAYTNQMYSGSQPQYQQQPQQYSQAPQSYGGMLAQQQQQSQTQYPGTVSYPA